MPKNHTKRGGYQRDAKGFGRLYDLRIKKNDTLEDAARHANCSRQSYEIYEKGTGKRGVPFDVLNELRKYYGVSIDYLTGISSFRCPENDYVGKRTGLIDSSIIKLRRIARKKNGTRRIVTMNRLINAPQFEWLLELLWGYPQNDGGVPVLLLGEDSPVPYEMARATYDMMIKNAIDDILKYIHDYKENESRLDAENGIKQIRVSKDKLDAFIKNLHDIHGEAMKRK